MENTLNQSADLLLGSLKGTVLDMINLGANLMDCAKMIGGLLGNDIARIVICDIALDLGKKEEVRSYLASFDILV